MRSREEFTVQVLRNGSGAPAGVGFVVDETHIVTCAHVVNTALGRRKLEQDQPNPGARVRVALPLLDGDDDALTLSCVVKKWMPPPTSGVSGGDVAGLAVDGDELPELARAAWLTDYREFRDAEAKVFGYPEDPPRKENGGWATVRVRGRVGRRMIELDVASESAFLVQPGYSGSPVVVTDADGHDSVIAMLSAAGAEGAKDALAIPAAALAQAWPEVVARLPIEKCPYRGLEAFTADDVDVFAGRKDDADRLRKMVRGRALTMVNGPSGVGKSSLVNAGLIPQLEAEGWATGAFRPGRDPVGALARTLASMEVPDRTPTLSEIDGWKARIRSAGLGDAGAQLALALDRSVVLHVDQFEEVLDPQVCAPNVRAEFLELLLSARSAADEGLHLVGTVRADFMAQLLEHPDAGTRLADGWFGLSPMSARRLKEVISEPAGARGVRYEDGLAAVIAKDAGDGPVLPLLEFALTQLWEHKRGPEISHAAYQAIGGVAGALSRYAENVYAEDLLKHEHFPVERIRRVLLALVRIRGGAADATRRVVPRDRLGAGWDIARTLARHRLVTIGRDDSGIETAELAHEALIRGWPTLQEWVEDDSVFQRWLTSAEERAANRELLPDNRIREADQWLDERAEDIPPEVQQLIQDSKSEQHRRETQLRKARNQDEARRLAALAESVLTTDERSLQIPLIIGIEALRKAPVQEADSVIRRAMRIAARPVTRANHEEPVHAVMFSRDGTRLAVASGDDRGGVVQVIDATTGAEISRITHRITAIKIVFSPDGTRLAMASGDDRGGVVQVIDAATGAALFRLDYSPRLNAVVFSLDGTRLAIANGWNRGEGGARVFDAVTGTEISRLDHGNPVSLDPTRWLYDKVRTQIHSRPVREVAFSPDGTRAATASNGPLGGGGDARVFDVATGTEIWNWDHGGPVNAVVFSPDGTRLATGSGDAQGNGQARMFDATTGTEIWSLDHGRLVHAAAFSPDGTRLATVGGDYESHGGGDARVMDAATGAVIWRIDHGSPVRAVVFSPDGTRLATVSHKYLGDTVVRVFDVASGAEISRLDHGSPVRVVVFSPDGTRLATGSGDDRGGVAWVFNATTGAEIWRRSDLSVNELEFSRSVNKLVFSPDGTRLATDGGGVAWVFNATTGAEIFCLAHGSNAVNKVVFSPNGTHLATASFSFMFGPSGDSRYGGSTMRVFDATTGAEIWHTDRGDLVNKVVFSPNGTRLAAAVAFRGGDPGGTAWVFDATTGAEIWRVEHDWEVCTVVFSPDGTRLATASGPVYDPSGEARVFDAATGAEIWRVDHGNPVYSVVFSPDGTRLAATSGKYRETGQARVFDAATGAEIWRVDHGNPVHAVVFSPDGTRLATGSGEYRKHSSGDGDARVFDAATGAEIWRVDHGNPVRAVAFSPDGTRLATGSGVDLLNYPYPRDGRVRLFDVANGAEVSRLDHGNPVRAVAFSPDGTQLASSDDSARVWCVDHSQLIEQALGRLTRNLTRQEWSSYFHEEPYRKTRADLA